MPLQLQSHFGFSSFAFRSGTALLGILFSAGSAIANHDVPVQTESSTTETTTTSPSSNESTVDQTRFDCQIINGQHTVMYYPQSQPGQSYAWATPTTLGGGWSADRRCAEISRRLESYRPDGLLEMQTAVENGYNTVCVTTQRNSTCRIVLTVPPGQDPIATRDSVFSNLTVADSGQQTQAVNTFTGREQDNILNQIGEALNLPSMSGRSITSGSSINLRPFLDQADGGTGARLQNGTQPSSPQLNPANFR